MSAAAAHAIVTALDEGGQGGAWRLDRSTVTDRLHTLIDAPELVRQGRLNLCGPAALFTIWLQRDPVAAATFAAELFRTGRALLGPIEVSAGRELREHGYDAGERGGNTPPADWMLMAALRDSTNRLLRYSRPGGLREAAAAITLPGAVAAWLAATGLFATVRDETTLVWRKGIGHARRSAPTAGRDVVALVAAEMFRRPVSAAGRARDAMVALVPNHWVILRSTIGPADGDQVAFRFWSWGGEHTAMLPAATFRRCYFGSLVADVGKTPLRPDAIGA